MTIEKRYDFVFLFDVQDSNPNGDPDAGNLPRIDPQTGEGLVTDVCLKRKVRNFIQMTQNDEHHDIFIREKIILNDLIAEAHKQDKVKDKPKGKERTESARQYMCNRYYDIRTFGAVLTTGENAGQVRGPVQLTFSRSIEPIVTLEHAITRSAPAKEVDNPNPDDSEEEKAKKERGRMGRKFTVPYGLYRCHGFISAHFAKQTGFSEEDLALFWKALINMFDHDHSAARGQMNARGLYVFEHSSSLGDAPADSLFKRIRVAKKDGVEVARNFDDYTVSVDETNLGETKLDRKLG
ncbi:type I-C CRISPR-associated protein Cas7/Csd2 [Aggregatibacter actinomycetemcomitans]|uniref:type I-C CRISPR-associated protein Cas7/Csd2 n=2 Tax=Aggregatibacter actinomycetemcomitans TaxID=714 RepID=UPI00115EB90A|nr:type I-C CRISPR-associated protein Cas7/Csd2 [Aggregatibacter actinomycetemcomitans]MBN6060196.1 type I-C CRISPR-associated protein Cas7/Csd2 [Aggregatibacter actinomycetemcomitans]MBN6088901.1 type I-C CRISPR-associated protein Cas7/Csd2 [Aggregatibacter actinomycetemcomitans]TQE41797.1 type I-C CRISPR-associated protein Cas7/Csd2 [Aggregatibacter actinomycetemcomitans]TYA25674.1 type I-C CRISPR-associated protein Cas7/Csd2 [Aggregatibacter actinomycetemcomitans]